MSGIIFLTPSWCYHGLGRYFMLWSNWTLFYLFDITITGEKYVPRNVDYGMPGLQLHLDNVNSHYI